MLHRIREAMREDHGFMFTGIVQADEYYHGGELRPEDRKTREKQKKTGRGTDKQPILGVYEMRSRTIRTTVIDDIKSETIQDAMEEDVFLEGTELHTDELRSYLPIGLECRKHRVVNHSDWYVSRDGAHTNHVENAWSLFARAVMGSFHYVSRKHLHRYLDEFDSRFNSRRDDSGEFFNRILKQADGRVLPEKVLVQSL